MKRKKGEWIFLYVMASLIAICSVLPFVWVLMTSLKVPEQIYDINQIIPKYITLDNFKQVLFHSNFVIYFLNSAFISIVVTIISMVLAIMAAYGFCRYRIAGAERIKMSILFTKMFPGVLLSIPYYVIMKKMGLVDTHLGLIIINCSFVLPFAVWNMCTFFLQIPWDVEESALIDGCSRFQSFVRVIFPMAKPGISATTLYCFLMSWGASFSRHIYSIVRIARLWAICIRSRNNMRMLLKCMNEILLEYTRGQMICPLVPVPSCYTLDS